MQKPKIIRGAPWYKQPSFFMYVVGGVVAVLELVNPQASSMIEQYAPTIIAVMSGGGLATLFGSGGHVTKTSQDFEVMEDQ